MPEQFYAERVLLGSDGLSSGTPPRDALCHALRVFSSAPVLRAGAGTFRRISDLIEIHPLDQIRRDRESALRTRLIKRSQNFFPVDFS